MSEEQENAPPARPRRLRRDAIVTAVGVAFSRLTGLLREQTFAYLFGASDAVQAFVAAFRIPNFLRDLLAENVANTAIVPVYAGLKERQGREAAARFVAAALGLVLFAATILVLLGILLAPQLCALVAAGFGPGTAKFLLTVQLTRWLFPFLLLIAIAAFLQAVQNAEGRFFVPAVATAGLNIGLIVFGWLFSRMADPAILGMAWGVLAGGVIAVLMLLPGYARSLSWVGIRDFRGMPEVREVLRLAGPVVLGVAATNVNVLINTLIASFAEPGALAFLNYSYRVMHLPLGLIAVSLATAALPALARAHHRDDLEHYRRTLGQALGDAITLALPAAAGLVLLDRDIIGALYNYGRFSETDTANTALALAAYACGIPAYSCNRVLATAFYARKDSKTPLKTGLAGIGVNIACNLAALWSGMGFRGIAAATAVAGYTQTLLYLLVLWRRDRGFPVRFLGLKAGLAVLATAAMMAALFGVGLLAIDARLPRLVLELVAGIGVYAAIWYPLYRLLVKGRTRTP